MIIYNNFCLKERKLYIRKGRNRNLKSTKTTSNHGYTLVSVQLFTKLVTNRTADTETNQKIKLVILI